MTAAAGARRAAAAHLDKVVGLALHGSQAAHLEHEPAVDSGALLQPLRQQLALLVELLAQVPHHGTCSEGSDISSDPLPSGR